jgi:hypothetical protein
MAFKPITSRCVNDNGYDKHDKVGSFFSIKRDLDKIKKKLVPCFTDFLKKGKKNKEFDACLFAK